MNGPEREARLSKRVTNGRKLWILVADATSARVFEARRISGPWVLLHALNPPPPAQEREGSARRAGDDVRFAAQLTSNLERARTVGAYDDVVLIAPPRFLGLLRTHAPPALRRHVSLEVARDLTRIPTSALPLHARALDELSR